MVHCINFCFIFGAVHGMLHPSVVQCNIQAEVPCSLEAHVTLKIIAKCYCHNGFCCCYCCCHSRIVQEVMQLKQQGLPIPEHLIPAPKDVKLKKKDDGKGAKKN